MEKESRTANASTVKASAMKGSAEGLSELEPLLELVGSARTGAVGHRWGESSRVKHPVSRSI